MVGGSIEGRRRGRENGQRQPPDRRRTKQPKVGGRRGRFLPWTPPEFNLEDEYPGGAAGAPHPPFPQRAEELPPFPVEVVVGAEVGRRRSGDEELVGAERGGEVKAWGRKGLPASFIRWPPPELPWLPSPRRRQWQSSALEPSSRPRSRCFPRS